MNEEYLQSEVIRYIKLKYPKVRYCASLGGIYTTPRGGAKAKRTGYSRGFPDLQITEARGSYFGLFIELKTLKGRPTLVQKEWIKDLKSRGYAAYICKGIDETMETIDAYMSKGKTIGRENINHESN